MDQEQNNDMWPLTSKSDLDITLRWLQVHATYILSMLWTFVFSKTLQDLLRDVLEKKVEHVTFEV